MNLRNTLHALVLATLAFSLSSDAAAQTVTFSTSEFVSSEWASSVSGTGSSVATTEQTGGNPGAYRRVSLTVGQNQSVANRQYWNVAVFNPSVQGAITSVSLSYDLSRVFTSAPGATQIAKGIAVKQDGIVYVSNSQGVSTVSPPTWDTVSVSNIVPLFPAVNWTNGREITFGFFNSVSASSLGFTIDGGYDNFRVTIDCGPVVPPKLYSVDRDSALLREINPVNGATLLSRSITLAGKAVTGATGMATDPVSGKLYALLRITPFVEGSPTVRELVTVDPNTGVATDLGPANNGTSLAFSDLAFGVDGTLYGVTGDSSATPETMFILNRATGAATFFKTLGNGDDGETIAFNPSNRLIYHASGQNSDQINPPPANFIFETINPAVPANPVSNIPLSGPTIDEATALVYVAADTFLWADLNFELPAGRLLRVTKSGSITLLGLLDHTATGLAFFPPLITDLTFSDATFEVSDWTAAKVEDTTAGASATFSVGQSVQGGNPGAFRAGTLVFGFGQVGVAHLKTSAVYNPATRGAILSISHSYDLSRVEPPPPGPQMAFGLAIRQGDTWYRSGNDTVSSGVWGSFGRSGLTAGNFAKVLGSGPALPDFSASGAPIQFGYIARDSTGGQTILTLTGGVDNWVATILSQALPGPVVNDGGVLNNAGYVAGPLPLAPGSIAAVFGSNLNNGTIVGSTSFGLDGKVVTTLGGSSATINNIPTPMLYSTPGQIGVQIPVELAGQTSATILVTVAGQTSAPRTINLDAFGPGIFTLNQQGTGPAVCLHQDNITPVTAENPAHPNEIVVFYGTGFGSVTPALGTGLPSTGNLTAGTTIVLIDGIPGGLIFSGAAPGFVGLNQVNVRIPASTRTAPNIPVLLSIGGKTGNPVTIPVGP